MLKYNQLDKAELDMEIMFSCDHPFLVGMHYVFQTDYHVYFVMPFVQGGELYKIFKTY